MEISVNVNISDKYFIDDRIEVILLTKSPELNPVDLASKTQSNPTPIHLSTHMVKNNSMDEMDPAKLKIEF